MNALFGLLASLLLVGVVLGTGLGTNYASPNVSYATSDCCTGPADGCNPCAGGTSTPAPTTTTTTTVPTTTPVPP